MINREIEIKNRLNDAFSIEKLVITDDSHLHIGHAGAKDGAGHFSVLIVTDDFLNTSRIKRHRLIYQAVNELMPTHIHALSIQAYTSDEYLK